MKVLIKVNIPIEANLIMEVVVGTNIIRDEVREGKKLIKADMNTTQTGMIMVEVETIVIEEVQITVTWMLSTIESQITTIKEIMNMVDVLGMRAITDLLTALVTMVKAVSPMISNTTQGIVLAQIQSVLIVLKVMGVIKMSMPVDLKDLKHNSFQVDILINLLK